MAQDQEAPGNARPFSLLGGPLHALGARLRLVRGGTNTIALGLVIGAVLWTVLAALAVFSGTGDRLFSLSVVGVHVRLLIVIPLLFVAEAWLDPRAAGFVSTLKRAGIVSPESEAALESAVADVERLKDAWLPELLFLAVAVAMSLFGSTMQLPGATSALDPGQAASSLPIAARWYLAACLPAVRFLSLRWIWRLLLWTWFLGRVARLDLRLLPTHPDVAGGLGYLEVVHAHLLPLVVAISAVQSASFAEDIVLGTMQFEAVFPALLLMLVFDAIVFMGPLFLFTPRMWACRVRGLREYMEFAEGYVRGFDRKWLREGPVTGEPLLGTPDLQSLADLYNSMSVVRNMRVVPASLGMARDFAVAALVPLLPLLLLKYPIDELARKFFARLSGL